MQRVKTSTFGLVLADSGKAIRRRARGCLIALACLGIVFTVAPVRSEAVLRIAATVNEDVISVYDLVHRMRLVLLTSRLPNTPEIRKRLTGQVLRNLIDERLQLQEAKRLKINITDEQVKTLLDQLNKQNGLSAGSLESMMEQNKIDLGALRSKLRAERAWMGVIRQQLRRKAVIGGEEIEEELARLRAVRHLPRHRVAEIFLPVDDTGNEAQVRTLAERLMEQLRRGAKFAALAREFSQSASAAVGGDLGWVTKGQLEKEIEQSIANVAEGQVAGPVRTLGGFHILLLLKSSKGTGQAAGDSLIDYTQLLLPVAPDAAPDRRTQVLSLATEIRDKISSCDDMREISQTFTSPEKGDQKSVKLSSLPVEMRKYVAVLKVNQTSEPIPVENGVRLVTICARNDDDAGLPSRQEIRQRLGDRRLNMLVQRYMRELRRTAFVDVRV
jgi:peptidyl-prolyl cis-trans isomerase SurA